MLLPKIGIFRFAAPLFPGNLLCVATAHRGRFSRGHFWATKGEKNRNRTAECGN